MCSLLSVCGMVCELSAAAPTQCMLPNAVLPVMMVLDSLTVSSRGSIPLISYFGHGVYHRSRKVAEAVHCCQHQSWFSLKGCVTSPCICPASKHKKLLLFCYESWRLNVKISKLCCSQRLMESSAIPSFLVAPTGLLQALFCSGANSVSTWPVPSGSPLNLCVFLIKNIYFYLYVWEYVYVSVCHICQCPWKPEEVVRPPEAEVTRHCQLPENGRLEPLKEQEVVWTLEPSLCPCSPHLFRGYQPLNLGFTII